MADPIDPLDDILDGFIEVLHASKCDVCGAPAAGSGAGTLYCARHFWMVFGEMERRQPEENGNNTSPGSSCDEA